MRSDTHSSQDYVKTPKIDKRITNDATIETDCTSNVRHDSNLRHDLDSTTSTKVNIPKNHNDEPRPDENFQVGVNTTYDLILTQTSQTHTDITQLQKNQLLRWHTEAKILYFFLFLEFLFLFPLATIKLQRSINNRKTKQITVINQNTSINRVLVF